jgi:hypothetical protein
MPVIARRLGTHGPWALWLNSAPHRLAVSASSTSARKGLNPALTSSARTRFKSSNNPSRKSPAGRRPDTGLAPRKVSTRGAARHARNVAHGSRVRCVSVHLFQMQTTPSLHMLTGESARIARNMMSEIFKFLQSGGDAGWRKPSSLGCCCPSLLDLPVAVWLQA